MKNARFSPWLAAAFLAGGLASWLLTVPPAWAQKKAQPAQPAQQAPNPVVRKWEYQCSPRATKGGYGEIESWLNEAGEDGWELVTVDPQGLYCMKKPR